MTTHKLDLASITAEMIVDAANQRGLRLMPGAFWGWDIQRTETRCCADTALALMVDPTIREYDHPPDVLNRAGIPSDFRVGLVLGFDGRGNGTGGMEADTLSAERYRMGWTLGQAVRRLVGLETAS